MPATAHLKGPACGPAYVEWRYLMEGPLPEKRQQKTSCKVWKRDRNTNS